MKKRTLFCFLLLIALLTAVLTGCTSAEETAHAETLTKRMLNALIADDYATAYGLLQDVCTEADFQEFYNQAAPMFDNVTEYTLEEVGTHVNFSLKDSYYQKSYRLIIGEEVAAELKVSFFKSNGGMRAFHISIPAPQTSTDPTAAM